MSMIKLPVTVNSPYFAGKTLEVPPGIIGKIWKNAIICDMDDSDIFEIEFFQNKDYPYGAIIVKKPIECVVCKVH